MDQIDERILALLKENARMSASDIGETINMSVSAVIERVKKLEASGIIKQYTVILDAQKIGKDISAFISVSLEHPKYNEGFQKIVREHPDIAQCYYITGDFDYLLKVVTESTALLEKVLDTIKSIQGVSLTKTIVVFSAIKEEYAALPLSRGVNDKPGKKPPHNRV